MDDAGSSRSPAEQLEPSSDSHKVSAHIHVGSSSQDSGKASQTPALDRTILTHASPVAHSVPNTQSPPADSKGTHEPSGDVVGSVALQYYESRHS